MKRKTNYQLMVPDNFFDCFENFEDVVDQLLYFFDFLQSIKVQDVLNNEELDEEIQQITEEFGEISQKYGKIKQEFGVINFEGNELFTRNTLTGLKLGLMMNKLDRVKSMRDNSFPFSYHESKEIIEHFANRYLLKKDED